MMSRSKDRTSGPLCPATAGAVSSHYILLYCNFSRENQEYVWVQVYFHWGIPYAFVLDWMEASLMPRQGRICIWRRAGIDPVLPWKRMMPSDLSYVNVAVFLSSCTGIGLPSLSLKLIWACGLAILPSHRSLWFLVIVFDSRSQSPAHLWEPNVVLWFLRHVIPSLPPSWHFPYYWDSTSDGCGLFCCREHSLLAIRVRKVKVCESVYFYWKPSKKMLDR